MRFVDYENVSGMHTPPAGFPGGLPGQFNQTGNISYPGN